MTELGQVVQRLSTASPLVLVVQVLRAFIKGQGLLHGAAMTYTTLFAVVPLMTVTYSMLASLPFSQEVGADIQTFLFSHFMPESGQALQQYLQDFTQQARQLTWIGVVFLIVTAFMMLKSIESTFNRIWGVPRNRQGVASFLLYWAVLSLGPLLLGAAFAISSYINTLPLFTDVTDLAGRLRLLELMPIALSTLAFALLYWAVPNCPVPWRHALLGGVMAALLFTLAKAGFAFYVTQFPSYQLVYGAFAAIPLFLLWVYISWLIIIFGAYWVHALSQRRYQGQGQWEPFTLALALMGLLWQRQQQGQGADEPWLGQQLQVAGEPLEQVLAALAHARLLERSEQGEWLLLVDIHYLTLEDWLQRLPWPLPEQAQAAIELSWQKQWSALLRSWREQRGQHFNASLAHLILPAKQQ
ncbi:YihY family inner membrane protein [Balneatrix alpica]|uniref:YihY family inner membrane protein n=1 Tax=Balneatrix alpica TaxID=75684 RepID=UPI0027397B20|nr:YihY family inner membrane protein [Balneatrix alpica]